LAKKGEEIETLKADLRRLMGVQQVHVNIEEIRKPEIDAQLIADSIAQQLEKRIMFRRAMKRAMQNAMRLGAQGIKIMSSGRLNGAEIARTEWYREGRVPLHTLRADIDYGFGEAKTTYGIIGIKVWVYRGETLAKADALASTPGAAAPGQDTPAEPKKAKKPAPRPGAKRSAAKPEGDAAKKPATRRPAAKKADGDDANSPKATVKRTRKPAAAKDDAASASSSDEGKKE